MQKLVVFLHANDPARPDWAVAEESGQIHDVTIKGDPALLAAAAKDRAVIVLIPSEDVLLTTVTLPKMNRSRLLQAIPFALEEQIIEDVETMHFAAGDYQPEQPMSVIVVSRIKMNEWMTLLREFNLVPDIMMPGIFALPYSENSWHAKINNVAEVRTGQNSGFACDKSNLEEMLTLALASTAAEPQQIEIFNADSETLRMPLTVKVIETKATREQQIDAMARQAAQAVPVNLLQGDFQNKKSRAMPKMTSLVKTAAYLGVVLIALLFLYPVVSFIILDQRAKDIKLQIAEIYKRQFPNSTSVVAPKDRMQQKLNKLNSGVSDNRFLMLTANIGKGLSQSSGVTLKRMDYQNNQVTLEISAVSSNAFSGFTDALSQQGLQVKQENANLSGARVNATLEIE
ncbi:MAG TPA: type II secretion system protein GspL [Gammaproteobacteria bacterium]|jgi:general secretion pathway protein L|nr:type II secretion system protein GspL [Gammaproteobacteria bacterium]